MLRWLRTAYSSPYSPLATTEKGVQLVKHRASSCSGECSSDAAAAAAEAAEEDAALPLTADRSSTWLYAAFHNITAMLGAGVLGLPHAVAQLGLVGGLTLMVLMTGISYVTFYQLVHMHEAPHPLQPDKLPPRRFNRFHELTQHAWGMRCGSWALLPFQIAVLVGLGVTYTVTGGSTLASLAARHGVGWLTTTHCIILFSAVELLLCQLPNFSALGWVSGMGALMAAGYSCIAVTLCLAGASGSRSDKLLVPLSPQQLAGGAAGAPAGLLGGAAAPLAGVVAGPASHDSVVQPGQGGGLAFFRLANAAATIGFAWGGHNVALEIQAGLPAGLPATPSSVPAMMRGMNAAYVVTSAAYFSVTCAGVLRFGSAVAENVLDSIAGPLRAVSVAEGCVVLHVLASWQVYSVPLFDMAAQALWRQRGVRLGRLATGAARGVYVAATCLTAACLPFFQDLMGLVGALCVVPTTFILPSLLWLHLKRPPFGGLEFWGCLGTVAAMAAVGVLGTLGSSWLIATHARSYKLFS